jgi:hypothetical protein
LQRRTEGSGGGRRRPPERTVRAANYAAEAEPARVVRWVALLTSTQYLRPPLHTTPDRTQQERPCPDQCHRRRLGDGGRGCSQICIHLQIRVRPSANGRDVNVDDFGERVRCRTGDHAAGTRSRRSVRSCRGRTSRGPAGVESGVGGAKEPLSAERCRRSASRRHQTAHILHDR